MFTVVITGAMGSGKTTVSQLFRQKEIPSIDADNIAHELINPEGAAYSTIYNHFGAVILHKNGQINREALRQIIFSKPEERIWLEHYLHPLILEQIVFKISELDAPYCLVEIPLLAETGKKPWMNRVLVIDSCHQSRAMRVKKRDGLSDAEIKKIFLTQASREKRLQLADDIVENTGSLNDLATSVNTLHNQYLLLAKKTTE